MCHQCYFVRSYLLFILLFFLSRWLLLLAADAARKNTHTHFFSSVIFGDQLRPNLIERKGIHSLTLLENWKGYIFIQPRAMSLQITRNLRDGSGVIEKAKRNTLSPIAKMWKQKCQNYKAI
jgi:hypothetical protein